MRNGFGGILKRFGSGRGKHVFARLTAVGILWASGAASAEPALTFVRDTPYCYVSTTGRVSTATFTVELWFKQTSFDGENQLFTQDNVGTGRIFLYTRNGKPYFQVSGNGLTGNTNLTASTWYHFACVRDASGYGTVYINGQAVTSPTYLNTDAPPSVTVTIGLLLRSKSGFRGNLSDVRIWNVARSQAEIQASMNVRLRGTESGLAHYWPFDEGTGTTVYDRAGNADGTVIGATWNNGADDLPITAPSGSWISSSGGNWSDTANWLSGSPAQGVNVAAYFTNNPPTAITVNNDGAGLALQRLTANSTHGIVFTGNTLALTNIYLSSKIATTNGSHTFALPLQTSVRGLFIETVTPGALTFSGVIGGSGCLSVNSATNGGGSVTLAGANTYTGTTAVGCGTLRVATLADGGQPSAVGASAADASNLAIGPGTLHYTGPAATINRGITPNPGSGKAALLDLDSDLTLTGQILAQSGAFIKRGPGTLTLAGAEQNVLGIIYSSNINGIAPYPDNGDSPANGFGAFEITDGKVILGASGQTNRVTGEVVIGGYTTALSGRETTGELVITGGYTRIDSYLDIGHHNGNTTTAPTPLHPRLTLLDGKLSAWGLIIGFGYETNQNTQPVLDIGGGNFQVDGQIRFGDQRGSETSPVLATMNLRGGSFVHTSASEGVQFGYRSPAANGGINIYGGLFDEYTDLRMGMNGSVSHLNLHGGVLRMRNITASTGDEYLLFDGCTLQPRTAGYTLSGLTAAYVSTNGAVIDTSLASYTVAQDLLTDSGLGGAADGGLVKLGTNTLTFTSYGSTYTGPTIISNGTLCIAGSLPADNALLVISNAEALVGGSATQTVTAARLTLDGNAKLGFAFALDGSTNDRLTVSTTPVIGAGSGISLYQPNSRLPFTKNGTYTLLSCSGDAPAVANLSCANDVYGKTYAFAVSGGNLTVTIGTDASTASVWKTNGSGNWSDANNWTVAPVSQAAVRFDEALSAPATVTVAGQTAGDLFFNNVKSYTLAGSGLALKSGAAVNVESGSHTISAPLTLAGDTAITLSSGAGICLGTVNGASSALTIQGNGTLSLTGTPNVVALSLDVNSVAFSNAMTITAPVALGRTATMSQPLNTSVMLSNTVSGAAGITKTGAGLLSLTASNTYSGVTTVNGGTLAVSSLANGGLPSAIGASSSASANLNLNGGTLRYTGPATAVNRGLIVNPGSGKAAILRLDNNLTLSGWINNASGALIKTGPGTLRYTLANGASTIGAASSASLGTQGPYPANGDAPANGFGSLTVAQGKAVFGAPGQTNYFNGEATVGAYTTSQAGQETTGELEFIDGYSVFSSYLDIGYYNGTTLTAPTPLQPTVTLSGGTVSAVGVIIAFGYNYFGSAYPNTHAVLNIAGGTLTVSGDFRFGDQPGSDMLATINVTSGALIHTSTSYGMGSIRGGNNTLNLNGGLVDEYMDLKMGANGSTSRVNLCGGVLRVRNITGGTGSEYLTFNGGTLQPRAAGQTMADALLSSVVSTNGAVIDTSLASYTIAQKLTHDPILGDTPDGGLLKLGANALTVTATNTFTGPINVRAGLLKAHVSSTNDLAVATNACFDAFAERATVGDLTGEGLLTNGVIALTGRLDAGTNGAPAGARMTIANLSLVGGATFACDWTTNALGQVTNDFVTVTGTLAPEGAGTFDLGRTEADPISLPFALTVMSYGSLSGRFSGWKAVNTGIPAAKHVATVVTAANGFVTLEVRYGGTVLLLH
jgi:fibronectin-binding autotransporter adhesin